MNHRMELVGQTHILVYSILLVFSTEFYMRPHVLKNFYLKSPPNSKSQFVAV